jgi:hypothetical protein
MVSVVIATALLSARRLPDAPIRAVAEEPLASLQHVRSVVLVPNPEHAPIMPLVADGFNLST